MHDNVNHPAHYNQGDIEPIDVIEDWGLGYHDGNALKYIARYQFKGTPVEDIRKAIFYLERLVQRLQADEARHDTTPEPQIDYPSCDAMMQSMLQSNSQMQPTPAAEAKSNVTKRTPGRQKSQTPYMFIQRFCDDSDTAAIFTKKMFEVYQDWCDEVGYEPVSEKTLRRAVMALPWVTIDHRINEDGYRKSVYSGITFRKDVLDALYVVDAAKNLLPEPSTGNPQPAGSPIQHSIEQMSESLIEKHLGIPTTV